MRRVIDRFPAVGEAMRSYGCMENAVLSSWVVNVGRRDALERMAHLICESHFRLSLVAPADQLRAAATRIAQVLGNVPAGVR